MMKNRHLSKAVASQKFYEFRTKLQSKCNENGIELTFFPGLSAISSLEVTFRFKNNTDNYTDKKCFFFLPNDVE